jgi:protein-ribulosamine 3-kinase
LIPETVIAWLEGRRYGRVVSRRPVGGGCINAGTILRTESDQTFFLKTNRNTPADMFAREAEGLEALAVAGGPRVPKPFLWGNEFLLMEDLKCAPQRSGYWTEFGRSLAALHDQTSEKFGFHHDNYIGSTPQPNHWTEDGYVFFADHRLKFQAELARNSNLLPREDVRRIEALADRLGDLAPEQPASLIHGDLWSGNATTDLQGRPAIIDPATHFGWAEAELAMTSLFGSFPQVFYEAYQETRPLAAGFRDRFPIYNLYHLLNHLNLFGRSYLGQVQAIIRRFS